MKRTLLFALLLWVPTAAAQISVRSALSDDREVTPGTTYEGVIQIWNESNELQEAKIYQTDYLFYADGSNFYGDPGLEGRSNAKWTRVSASTVTLPPGERVPLSYYVEVPETINGQAPQGSYWSMIMVEAVPKESPESTINPISEKPEYSVLQLMRYGVQVATHIAGTGEKMLDMSASRLTQTEEIGMAFEVSVENTGSLMTRPEVWIELYDAEGKAHGRREGVQNRIYPGTSVRQAIPLGDLEPGEYRALVILDDGQDDVFGAEYRLRIE